MIASCFTSTNIQNCTITKIQRIIMKYFGFLDRMEYDNLLTILDDVRTEYFVDVTLFKVNEFD